MKKYKILFIVAIVFALPIMAAKLMLQQHWYQGGVTNKGHLLQPPVTVSDLAQVETWQLVYTFPSVCDDLCKGALFNLRQVPQAAGANRTRLNSVVFVTDKNELQSPLLQGLELRIIDDVIQQKFTQLEYGLTTIYIADPHGNMMMAYPLVAGKQAILDQGKDVLRDLKRLLKVSKIG